MADAKIEATVKEALEMFRPQLQADGGDMEYVGIDDEMKVHLNLKMGIERYLKDACPEIKEVVQDNAVNYGEGFEF